ncbi:hypothetical protein C5B42_05240 [Candidatus Cerribacteria bacterium 'Amazon FNV 2010 28 9']|uniref:Phage holin family protein n=1 Tax=Candidatus Cerribacteria bacterium 'Amazon FNV 2010 28 9' TaxID=2081795 RepID=A0A317JMI6_9BACT|nr:MAG: hypothetical protein C5B42_05240 [Candidatus Cerribacteria bacterium 'Amazon FNV 2010 28 9']
MRSIIRALFFYILSLALLAQLFSFVTISGQTTLIVTAVAFLLLNTVCKPLIKILWLPINIITLGLFSWMVNVIVVFLATLIVPGFHLSAGIFPSIVLGKYFIPSIHLSVIWTYLFFSFALSFTKGLLDWLLTKRE